MIPYLYLHTNGYPFLIACKWIPSTYCLLIDTLSYCIQGYTTQMVTLSLLLENGYSFKIAFSNCMQINTLSNCKQIDIHFHYMRNDTLFQLHAYGCPVLLHASGSYLSLPPTRQNLTQGQKPEGRLKWG